jgi:hypothetical protein
MMLLEPTGTKKLLPNSSKGFPNCSNLKKTNSPNLKVKPKRLNRKRHCHRSREMATWVIAVVARTPYSNKASQSSAGERISKKITATHFWLISKTRRGPCIEPSQKSRLFRN